MFILEYIIYVQVFIVLFYVIYLFYYKVPVYTNTSTSKSSKGRDRLINFTH